MRILCIVTIVIAAAGLEWFEQNTPFILMGSNFNSTLQQSTHCKFVKFFTPWCRFCRVLKTIIDEHRQATYQNRTDVRFYEVDCHQSPDICMPLEVYLVPYVMIFDKNGERKQTAAGVYPKEWYVEMIESNCNPNYGGNGSEAEIDEERKVQFGGEEGGKERKIGGEKAKDGKAERQKGETWSKEEERGHASQSKKFKQQNGRQNGAQNFNNPQGNSRIFHNINTTPHLDQKRQKNSKPIQNLNLLIEEDNLTTQFPKIPPDQEDESSLSGQDLRALMVAVIFLGICGLLHYKYCSKKDNKDTI